MCVTEHIIYREHITDCRFAGDLGIQRKSSQVCVAVRDGRN